MWCGTKTQTMIDVTYGAGGAITAARNGWPGGPVPPSGAGGGRPGAAGRAGAGRDRAVAGRGRAVAGRSRRWQAGAGGGRPGPAVAGRGEPGRGPRGPAAACGGAGGGQREPRLAQVITLRPRSRPLGQRCEGWGKKPCRPHSGWKDDAVPCGTPPTASGARPGRQQATGAIPGPEQAIQQAIPDPGPAGSPEGPPALAGGCGPGPGLAAGGLLVPRPGPRPGPGRILRRVRDARVAGG